jgi:hypothetical protein
VDLLAPAFCTLDDRFDPTEPDPGHRVRATDDDRPVSGVTRGPGGLEVGADGRHGALLVAEETFAAPYATVRVEVFSCATGGDEHDGVLVGLVDGAGEGVLGRYDPLTGTATIDLHRGGTVRTLASAPAEPDVPCALLLCLTGPRATLLVEDAHGTRPLVRTGIARHLDVRDPERLADLHPAVGVRASDGTAVLRGFAAGYFGQAGLRDLHVVTHADGRPYVADGRLHLTATCAGLGFFQTAHWGVWTLDPDTLELEHVGKIFSRREGPRVLGDHAGHVVRDEQRERWIVTTSTWGDFSGTSVAVNHTTVPLTTDLMRGVHVLGTAPLPLPVDDLPGPTPGQWDPHVALVDDRWYVAFVNAREFFDFYPALARSAPGADYDDLSLVGADPSRRATEGTVLQRIDDRWLVLASNGDASPAAAREQYPVYDLAMAPLGRLDAPHPTNIPWPMVVPAAGTAEGGERWLLLTFDGTPFHDDVLGYGTHGDVVVMEATRRAT